MTFEEFLATASLPSMAKEQLPNALSESTKNELLKAPDAEKILLTVIDDINHGNVNSIEVLVKEKLRRKR